MSAAWELPASLTVGGAEHAIRTDFRDVLYVLDILADPDYEEDEKALACIAALYEDYESIPPEQWPEALEKAMGFIDGELPGSDSRRRPRPRAMDWRQDGPLIIPAVNKVLGCEARAVGYLHWWTFLGAYMEIGEGLFATVVGIRQKRAKGKKLEKYEQEFYAENRALIELRRPQTSEDAARRSELKKLFV